MTRLAALLLAPALACASGDAGPDRPTSTIAGDAGSSTGDGASSGTADEGGHEGPTPCVPGQQIACPCPGGSEGAQACNAAGTGYEPCVCPGADGETSTSTDASETTGLVTTEPQDTGNTGEQCPADEACDACAFCGVDSACKEPYANCTAAPICNEAVNCVINCGFVEGCITKCAPPDGTDETVVYNTLVECLTMVCPQCPMD